MALVVDASAILAWCLNETAPSNDPHVLKRIYDEGIVVPSIWSIEAANGLLQALRRARLDKEGLERFVKILGELRIHEDVSDPGHVFSHILQVGADLGLTAYDASYVELARRLACPLVTTDFRMASAAQSVGVTLYP